MGYWDPSHFQGLVVVVIVAVATVTADDYDDELLCKRY